MRGRYEPDTATIASTIKAARAIGERITSRTLSQAQLVWHLPQFEDVLRLPRGPIVSVARIDYLDTNIAIQTVGSSVWTFDDVSGVVELASGQAWPACATGYANSVRVYYTAGYADAASVDEGIKQAIRQTVAHLYERRGDIPTDEGYLDRVWMSLFAGCL